ncbi:lysostaphin resistance A-like protein, partial [Chloroflexota bacterium]
MENTSVSKRVWGPWATAGFGIVVIVISLITQVLVVGVFAVIRLIPDAILSPSQLVDALSSRLGLLTALSTFASAVVCVGLIIAIVKVRRSATVVEYLGLRPITGMTILVTLAITAGFMILSEGLSISLERPVPEFMVDVYNTSVWPALLWISIVIFAPAFEETFFRGFLFEGFRRSRIGISGTIGLTALVWALSHVQYGTYEIVTIFVMGIILGIVRLKTGSLWSTLLMHALYNLIAMLQMTLYING